jgi:3-oxoadipate enol-lactonase
MIDLLPGAQPMELMSVIEEHQRPCADFGLSGEIVEAYDLGYDSMQAFRREDGTEIYYEVRGSGPPLCIVNNMYIVGPLWKNFTSKIVQQHTVVTYDLRNQGASTTIDGDLTVADHVADLLALLDVLKIEQAYLLGTSISTLICRDFAVAHPERVSGLVLLGPFFNPLGSKRRKYLTRSWLRSLERGGPRGLFDHFYPLVFGDHTIENGGSPAYLALRDRFLALNSQRQLEKNLSASLTTTDDPAKLADVRCPTLLAAGEADFFCSPSSLEGLAQLLPSGRAEVIPYAGHVPYFEATDYFEELVLRFVGEIEIERSSAASTR